MSESNEPQAKLGAKRLVELRSFDERGEKSVVDERREVSCLTSVEMGVV